MPERIDVRREAERIARLVISETDGPNVPWLAGDIIALVNRVRDEQREVDAGKVEALSLIHPRGGYEGFYGGGRKSAEQFRTECAAAIRIAGEGEG